MQEDNVKYRDAEEYVPTQDVKLTFKDLIMQHLKKITTYVSEGETEKYKAAVDCLSDLLHIKYDEIMQKTEDEIRRELNEKIKSVSPVNENLFNYDTKNEEFIMAHELICTRKLFRALCDFLGRKNYLNLGDIED